MTNTPYFFDYVLFPLITITVLAYIILLVVRVFIGKSAFSACIFRIRNFLKDTLSKDTSLRISTTKLIIATAILSAFSVITAITVYQMFAHTSFIADADNVNGFMDIAFGLPVTVASSVLAILLAWNAITIANRQLDLEASSIRREVKPRMEEQVLETISYVTEVLKEFGDIAGRLHEETQIAILPAELITSHDVDEFLACMDNFVSTLQQMNTQDQYKAKLFIKLCIESAKYSDGSLLGRQYPDLRSDSEFFNLRLRHFSEQIDKHRRLFRSHPELVVNGVYSILVNGKFKFKKSVLLHMAKREAGLQFDYWKKQLRCLDYLRLCSDAHTMDIVLYEMLSSLRVLKQSLTPTLFASRSRRGYFIANLKSNQWLNATNLQKQEMLGDTLKKRNDIIFNLAFELTSNFNRKHGFFTKDEIAEINRLAHNAIMDDFVSPLVSEIDAEVYRMNSGYYDYDKEIPIYR